MRCVPPGGGENIFDIAGWRDGAADRAGGGATGRREGYIHGGVFKESLEVCIRYIR